MNKNTFKAQALAIVMIVLVVASVIGIALFSRMARDRQISIGQQDSARAAEQADSILNMFVGADALELESNLSEEGNVVNGMTELAELLQTLGVAEHTALLQEHEWCEGGEGNSFVKATLGYAEDGDFMEIQPGAVRAYNFEGASLNPEHVGACVLNISFESRDDIASVFGIKIVYTEGDEVKEEFRGYCIGNCGGLTDRVEHVSNLNPESGDNPFVGEIIYNPGSDNPTSINYQIDVEALLNQNAFTLAEIRILPLHGTLAVSDSIADCVNKQFRPIRIAAEVNCSGSSRGKVMFLPGSGNLGYPTLFDYAIYDTGLFQP